MFSRNIYKARANGLTYMAAAVPLSKMVYLKLTQGPRTSEKCYLIVIVTAAIFALKS